MLNAGLVEEVRGLLAKGYPPDLPAFSAIGYREIIDYLLGKSLSRKRQLASNARPASSSAARPIGSSPMTRTSTGFKPGLARWMRWRR